MKNFLLFVALSMTAITTNAATFAAKWTDPTPVTPAYVAGYVVKIRVNGVELVPITGLTSPQVNTTIPAVSGDTVEFNYKAINNVIPLYPIPGNESAWFTAVEATAPGAQGAPSFVVIVY